MRWMWIDTITAFEPKTRMVAIKNVSMAEEHLHAHFAADADGPARPLMPNSLILEGMAQTAGILVGSVHDFREKVVLAKVQNATITGDVGPGQTIRYDARIERMDAMGASTVGIVSRFDHRDGEWREIGTIELMFSHLDQNMQGMQFPEENFVFGENFRTILAAAGFGAFGG
ncbi:MAG: beta-hydroxyacyl-ACP dehydratase [Phycisphaerae bacterium]|jgi:3-hydroxyacyl-[acyl-carrier-protein] dehydratase|nr:beta-hydroxyacyl-ACP dehydratase [Phycisphaerae bacterium]